MGSMVTGPEGRRRAATRVASASVGNGNASFSGPHVAVGNLRVSQTECPPGYAIRITNIAKPPLCLSGGFRRYGGPAFAGVVDALGSMKVAEPGSGPGSLAHSGLVGVSGTTAGTPSGLMLKARKVSGSLPGLPHWWTRPEGS